MLIKIGTIGTDGNKFLIKTYYACSGGPRNEERARCAEYSQSV